MALVDSPVPELQFSKRWHLLGPFRIGTREAVWGANPLEAYGGFHRLPVDSEAKFHSSLGIDGLVKWSTLEDVLSCGSFTERLSIELNIAFPSVNWTFQQSVYGWPALQYQAYARGFIDLTGHSSHRVAFSAEHVLELAVNDSPIFGGDVYGFCRAPMILDLVPGKNKIDLRLIRDVRAMGGIGSPSIFVRLSFGRCDRGLNVVDKSTILPDVINGKLTSPYASVILCNAAEDWVSIVAVRSYNDSSNIRLLSPSSVSFAPGQSRPVGLYFSACSVDVVQGIRIAFVYKMTSHQFEQATPFLQLNFCQRLIQSPHKFTFLHPSGTVSYAILRPPSSNVIKPRLPILMNLHGAGLESDSHQVRHMLDAVPELDAWVLFPTGMSPWSGDDWHVWGYADVTAAVSAIPQWIRNMNWSGPGVDTESWFVTGHSNGGQGAWFISTHQPDKVIATAALSGYSSIQNYVPYLMWREVSPLVESIVQNSLSSYRHELLVENMKGIPIYQQHGAEDDNVPPYHSRLIHSLLHESGCPSTYMELSEQGHWFDGVMTTGPLRAFYMSILDSDTSRRQIPKDFRFCVPNSGDTGYRMGILADQLESPDYLGTLSVHRDDEERLWHIKTSNMHRMHLCFPVTGVQQPKALLVDETSIQIPTTNATEEVALVRQNDKWKMVNGQNWKCLFTRYGRQRGSLDAILRTSSPFKMQVCSDGAQEAALQVSRNLIQYYRADAEIVTPEQYSEGPNCGNVITLVLGNAVLFPLLADFPIQVHANGIEIRRPGVDKLKRIPSHAGLGTAFLRPLHNENLELVLWGYDSVGLQQAVRMVPILTGAGQPDFIVLDNDARWKGVGGVLAMGFFDYAWQISQASYIP
ncbi:hypothetical protein EPUS_06288 [Endocarpon pusillum Z07020]|uniref:Peptidase S9 prolyl oligopeptidase catalytic domain-containing protein n=1 Tax=Endocarpon pusillum (strain Z07020 / HMAS-L-300199) TaxID=1263415 RepID=U1I1D7_ENDPU|nr:uncharacterized protein EPUS_06288 [Endocarpon pusillum Z07020]ERF77070.1 hypothetical protein EPUS_06288 [Endocarpon pusillum Z07020]